MTEQPSLMATEAQEPKVAMTSAHARAMISARYAAPEWATMFEVAPKTGGGTRYADAVAVNLWQSRGHAVHGFEVKVARSDWLRELKDPSKAEPVYRYCDHWWIVAPRGVVKDGELPPTWGLLELRATNLTQIVAAPRPEPQPIGRAFFASLMRRGFEELDRMAQDKVRDAINRAHQESQRQIQAEVERRTRDRTELQRHVDKFTEATGLTISPWVGPPIELIKLAQQLQKIAKYHGSPLNTIERMAADMERAAGILRETLAASGLTENGKSEPEASQGVAP